MNQFKQISRTYIITFKACFDKVAKFNGFHINHINSQTHQVTFSVNDIMELIFYDLCHLIIY